MEQQKNILKLPPFERTRNITSVKIQCNVRYAFQQLRYVCVFDFNLNFPLLQFLIRKSKRRQFPNFFQFHTLSYITLVLILIRELHHHLSHRFYLNQIKVSVTFMPQISGRTLIPYLGSFLCYRGS